MKTIKLVTNQSQILSKPKEEVSILNENNCIKEPCILELENGGKLIYIPRFLNKPKDLGEILNKLKYTTGKRSNGILEKRIYFGSRPKKFTDPICSKSEANFTYPVEWNLLSSLAKIVTKNFYCKYDLGMYRKLIKEIKKEIHSDYHIKGSPFTSIVINKNSAMRYHFDSGNIKNSLSAMIVLKNQCHGGQLVFPNYNIHFNMNDGDLILFNGNRVLHGVNNFNLLSPEAYRLSIVFFSRAKMCECKSLSEELKKAQELESQKTDDYAKKNRN